MPKKNKRKRRRPQQGSATKNTPHPEPTTSVAETHKETVTANEPAGHQPENEQHNGPMATRAENVIAACTVALTLIAVVTGSIMFWQSRQIQQQIVQNEETLALMKLQTPRSLVRPKEVTATIDDKSSAEVTGLQGNDTVVFRVSANLENVGGIPARIKACAVAPIAGDFSMDMPIVKQLMRGDGPMQEAGIVLTPGDSWTAQTVYVAGEQDFYIFVVVRYIDTTEGERSESFLYKYSQTTGKVHRALRGDSTTIHAPPPASR